MWPKVKVVAHEWLSKNKKNLIIGLVLLVLVMVAAALYYWHAEKERHRFHVTFLNIGQGDSALINFANGETMLVDCGPNQKVLSELGHALPVYMRTIDYVLATHPDLDHYGGCVDVLRRYAVKHIIINGHAKTDPYYKEWEKAVREELGADTIVMHAPQTWTIGSSTLQFFSPDDSLPLSIAADDSNNYSIVFKLIANTGKTFLFTGDMEEPLENALVEKYCSNTSTVGVGVENFQTLRAPTTSVDVGARYILPQQLISCPALQSDILKVGHHGSNSSSGQDFLQLVRPHTAIISVGQNKYGHPSLRVIKKLERAGAALLRTDELGAIVLR